MIAIRKDKYFLLIWNVYLLFILEAAESPLVYPFSLFPIILVTLCVILHLRALK